MPIVSVLKPPSAFIGSGLACRRGGRLVFEGLDFELRDGGVLLVTGPNGSGKSSLLRVMAGLTPPERGSLAWNGADLAEDPGAHRGRLHFIGHQNAVKPALTVLETLRFWAGLRGGVADTVIVALERFHLRELADWPCRFLSAGQRHRLALARLVASPAPLWLLDEPTTALDGRAMTDLLTALSDHRVIGGRVAIATHGMLPIEGAASLSLADFAPRRAA